jgi:hypothetical protein
LPGCGGHGTPVGSPPAISLLLAAFGTAWFIERAWDLQLMPF